MLEIHKIKKIDIFDNRTANLTIDQVKAKVGCHLLFNCWLYDVKTEQPCCDIKDNGKVLNDDQWTYFGYAWNEGDAHPVVAHTNDMPKYSHFVSCIWAIHNGMPQPLDNNAVGVGGKRGRTAWGFTIDWKLVSLCTSDAAGAMTLTETRDLMLSKGCVNCMIDDSGSSSQSVSKKGSVYSGKIVTSFICVWFADDDEADITTTNNPRDIICLDPGHGLKELNCSPDKSYYEYKFALIMSRLVGEHLIRNGLKVVYTKMDDSTPGLVDRAIVANKVNADLFLSFHTNAIGKDTDGILDGWDDSVSGLSVWTCGAGGERDIFAQLLINEMSDVAVNMFGQKLYHDNFTVLTATHMPAALCEYAFHTNHQDVKLLLDPDYQAILAEATARAIVKWCNRTWVPMSKPIEATYTIVFKGDEAEKAQKFFLDNGIKCTIKS